MWRGRLYFLFLLVWMKCLNAFWQEMDLCRGTIPQVIAPGMHLELLSQEKGTGCLCRLVWIMWAWRQNSHREARLWGEREIFLHHWFLKRMKYIAFFPPFLSGQGNECGYIWLAANSTFCQIFWGVCNVSSSNPSSAGFSISVTFDMRCLKNQHSTGHLTCLTTLVLVILTMWFIPDIKVYANFASRMDVRDWHVAEHWQIPVAPLFCSLWRF